MFLFLGWSLCSKDLKQWTSVTVQDFIKQAADGTPSRGEDRLTPKEWPQSLLSSPFDTFYCLLLEPALCKTGLVPAVDEEGSVIFPTRGSHSSSAFSVILFSWAFSFLCLPFSCRFLTAILNFSLYSNYLTHVSIIDSTMDLEW